MAIAASVLVAAAALGWDTAHADPGALADIAREVLRRAASGPAQSAAEPTTATGIGDPVPSVVGPAEAPSQRGHSGGPATSVTVPRTVSPPKTSATMPGAAGYPSNSWRQVPAETARALTFSSGYVRPAPGLDPALRAHGVQARAESRAHVYGFLLPRVALDGALEKALAGLGVRVLGPHDDHYKVRVPVSALDAVAALPEVEWLGVSPPRQKQSLDLEEARAARASAGVAAAPAIGLPIVINLFEPDGDGSARRRLEAAGAIVADYDPALAFYRAVASEAVIDRLAALDVVLFVELIRQTSVFHDQSMPLVDADLIRLPGPGTRFGGAPITVGILDSGFMLGSGAQVPHDDLSGKNGCGANFTTDAAGVWNDQNGHGTHVLGTIAGAGNADARYRGMAPFVGTNSRIRAGKVFIANGSGFTSWAESGMDFMSTPSECDSPAPLVVNLSGGYTTATYNGTDSTSRKLDDAVWTNRQVYVIAAGNSGSAAGTVRTPGVAKNALTVGNVLDNGFQTIGDIAGDSSRGPTADNRMKPNVTAPGNVVTSVSAGTKTGYRNMSGTSMATPHVTGLVATLMEHFPEMQSNPPLVRAHLMSTAIAHDDVTGMSNDYGIGRIAGYPAHWAQDNANGWSTHWSWGTVSDTTWHYRDITVPAGARRLVVVMTFDEPAASAGASRAVTYDVDLWVDYLADCNNSSCGDWFSISSTDNVEYIVIDNPPAGLYRLKATNFRAPSFPLPVAIAATIINGDPTPPMAMTVSVPATVPYGGYDVTATVSTPSYVASAVHVQMTAHTGGTIVDQISSTRHDGVATTFLGTDAMTLGNVYPGLSRTVTWRMSSFFTTPTNPVSFTVRAWSENGGTVTQTVSTVVAAPGPDLVETAATTNPAAPFVAPGGTFSVTDTAKNNGSKASTASTTRYYLSLDGGKDAGDVLLSATRAVPALAIGATSSGTVTLTVPATIPLNTYFLLACADDLATNAELDETNNCAVATTGAITVTRPDLIETGASTTPASPVRAPGTTLSVTDTVGNAGRVASGSSTTRYYLSLDGAKSAGDTLLAGTRTVPGLASAATHTGTATVTIPAAMPPGTYYLLACADDLNAVVETSDTNNCVAAGSGLVTVARPDLIVQTLSSTPSAVVRAPGGTFSITDRTLNAGQVASAASTTRYYLSLNGTKDAGDTLLTGTHNVPALAAGAGHSGTVTVTIPASTPLNNYVLLACADDTGTVAEVSEGNNCLTASGAATISVTRPDLVETSLTTTPAAPVRAPGTTFSVTDTARNNGGVASGASTTRYYLSLDGIKSAGDVLLTGTRNVPGLAAGTTSTGTVTVTIPANTPLATYTLLACADAADAVAEIDESNNCVAASSGAVTVTRPDLVEDAVSPPPASKARGTAFSVTDTARNAGGVASAATTTRYYLSLDGAKGAGDTLLTGTRSVAGLAPGGTSTGTVSVTIPAATPLNTYFLLACADDASAAVETSEANNCRASATTVTVTP